MDQQDRLAAVAPVRGDVDIGEPQAVGIEELDHARRHNPPCAARQRRLSGAGVPARGRGAPRQTGLGGGGGSALIALDSDLGAQP